MKDRACPEIERLVLGAIVHRAQDEFGNTAAEVLIPLLRSSDFADAANAATYQAVRRVSDDKAPMSVPQVVRALREANTLGIVTEGYVSDLPKYPMGLFDLEKHVATLREVARARRLARAAETVLAFNESNVSNADFIARAKRFLDQAAEDDGAGIAFESASEGFQKVYNACESGTKPVSWFSGFGKLDVTLGGFHPGTLNILAARPGVGKTSLAATIAYQLAGAHGVPVLMFSLEMYPAEIWERLISAEASVGHDAIRRRHVGTDELSSMAPAVNVAEKFPFYIHKPRAGQMRPSVDDMVGIASAFKRRHKGLSMLVVDYLQLAVRPGNVSMVERLAEISGGLKLLARELECAVLALSQLNRESTKTEDARPNMGQLRGSGAIEQDADSVILMHKPKKPPEKKPVGYTEVIVDKNRHGPTGTVEMVFHDWLTKFEEMEAVDANAGNNWDGMDVGQGDFQ